jgi:phosphomannomutase
MSEPIISVSGLRGIIGDQLTPLVATQFVAAYASTLPSGAVVIGRDGRESGWLLARAVAATLAASGLKTIDLDIAATPTVGVQVRESSAVGGIQISASHNPREYNGFKLFGSDGRVLPGTQGGAILSAYRKGQTRWVSEQQLGDYQLLEQPHAVHARRVLSTVDVESIRAKNFRVLLDSNHGAGSLLGKPLLEQLGCQVTVRGAAPNGDFAHAPEPIAENLSEICQTVIEGGFDVGFCQDPDADRLAIIDEGGRYIGEEMTLALCLLQVLPKTPGNIVTNCASSGLSRFIAQHYNCPLFQSAVGEANVADLMIEQNAVFGGEGNGGPIDPQVGYVRDSFVGMARILDLLASSQRPISQLVNSLPPLSIVKDKIKMATNSLPRYYGLLTDALNAPNMSRQDGLKLEWDDRWLLIRGSNTEPIVRLIAEAPTVKQAQELCDRARQLASRVE